MNSAGQPTDITLPVQRQLEAHNARDIDAFMQWWADDCQYYEFPSRLLANGADEIRRRHIARFIETIAIAACGTQRLSIARKSLRALLHFAPIR
jgi:hypothetical protein